MIIRIWKGTTTSDNSEKYEQLLKDVVFPGIQQRDVRGYNGIQLLKRSSENTVNYVTIMAFENWEAVKQFAGEDYKKSYVIDEAKVLLNNYDYEVVHYEIIHNFICK